MYRLIIVSVGFLLFLYYAHVIAFLFGIVKSIGSNKKVTLWKCLVPFYFWINLK